jgi:hypothetical protein
MGKSGAIGDLRVPTQMVSVEGLFRHPVDHIVLAAWAKRYIDRLLSLL